MTWNSDSDLMRTIMMVIFLFLGIPEKKNIKLTHKDFALSSLTINISQKNAKTRLA